MHPNPAFRKPTTERNIAFAQERAFGMLAVNSDDGPLISHIPFRISSAGDHAELHLLRSNPIVGLLSQPVDAVIAVVGGDTYVSPDWYEIDDQVPTWNYVAVHLRGKLSKMEQDELHGVLSRLSHSMETRLQDKKPWTSDKMDQTVYERMQRQIVPIELDIASIDGTWKLSQNKSDEVRLRAAKGARGAHMGSETEKISGLMADPD
ncbi:MAG: FMN-binding negative transcriptional regulator [Pseudomonadota bacterium]